MTESGPEPEDDRPRDGSSGSFAPPDPPPPPPPHGAPPPPYGAPPPPPHGAPPPPHGAPPPPPYYGAPYGTGAPPPPYGPGITAQDDTTWALAGYLGQFAVGFVAPLVVYLARKDQSPFVRFHGAQALNLALSYLIFVFAGVILAVISAVAHAPAVAIILFLAIFVFAIVHLVYLVIGAVRAGRREMYRIPAWLAWPMFR
jgi:uncharacterized Tic20 family protein